MAITPAKRDGLLAKIRNRLLYVEATDKIVNTAYANLMDILSDASQSAEGYAMDIANALPPEKLFHAEIVESEGRVFYAIIRDILVTAGLPFKPSRQPLPMQVAQLLYVSPESVQLSQDDELFERQTMVEALRLFQACDFPFGPKFHEALETRPHPSQTPVQSPTQSQTTHSPSAAQLQHDYTKLIKGATPAASAEKHAEMLAAAQTLRDRRHESKSHSVPPGPRPKLEANPVQRIQEEPSPAVPVPASPSTPAHPTDIGPPPRTHEATSLQRRKSSFISALMKRSDKEADTFTGTDGKSWTNHLKYFTALAKAYDVTEESIMLEMIQFSLGPGPKMLWDRYQASTEPTWNGFLGIMLDTYSSSITHARTRDAIMSVSLQTELSHPDTGSRDTRHSRAVTRVVNKLLRLAEDLPSDERQDKQLLQYLRMAIRGVEFTKNSQLISVQNPGSTFDSLSLSVQTAAQVEDNYTRNLNHRVPKSFPIMEADVDNFEDDFDTFFVDRRLGKIPHRRSKKCGNNRKLNGSWKGEVMRCHDCKSEKHLKFHRECSAEVERRKKGGGVLHGVQKQLQDGVSPVQILACLANALEDATLSEPTFSGSDGITNGQDYEANYIEKRNLSKNELEKEDELFSNNFAERLVHSITGALSDTSPTACAEDGDTPEIHFTENFIGNPSSTRSSWASMGHAYIASQIFGPPRSIQTNNGIGCGPLEVYFGKHSSSLSVEFQGAVIDTGAARSCIGVQQANAYANLTGLKQHIRSSKNSFKFGNVCHQSRGIMTIMLPTPDGRDIRFEADVVNANVPLLLGLNTLDSHQLLAKTRANTLEHPDWSLPLVRQQGHVWVRWPTEVLYSRSELLKLHRHYRHPSAGKLYALLKRINPKTLPSKTLRVLKEIQKSCEPCDVIDRKKLRFQVGSADASDIVFNREIVMDIVKIGNRNALHVIDSGTHFGAAQFLHNVDTQSVWDALLECWVLVYAGQPDVFFMDQGSVFTSDDWKDLADANGVVLKFSGVQHHNGIAICERYHAPLRKIFRKIEIECPDMDPDLMLKTAVKSMNDTLGPEGLVPSMLVFGIMPRYSPAGLEGTLLAQEDRMRAIKVARDEYFKIVNNLRVSRALKSQVPEAADHVYSVGDLFRVYREDKKAYSDPVPILRINEDSRLVTVEMTNGLHQLYSITQLKPYRGSQKEAEDLVRKVSDSYGPWLRDYVRPDSFEINITEVIDTWDPRAKSPKMTDAIKKEIQGLIERGCFRVVLRDEIPDNANVLGCRLVLAIKDAKTGKERYKARLVIGGHRDKDKASLVHASPNLRCSRLLRSWAFGFGLKILPKPIYSRRQVS